MRHGHVSSGVIPAGRPVPESHLGIIVLISKEYKQTFNCIFNLCFTLLLGVQSRARVRRQKCIYA